MEDKKENKKVLYKISTSLTKEDEEKIFKAIENKAMIMQKGLSKMISDSFINDYVKKISEQFNDGKMQARFLSIRHLAKSQHWEQFWSLLVEIFEEKGENLGKENFVPIKMEFEGYLYHELYSDYQLYQLQKDKIKKGLFETKYFEFNTVNNSFKPKSAEIKSYLINLFLLPTRFLEASKEKMVGIVREWMKENFENKFENKKNINLTNKSKKKKKGDPGRKPKFKTESELYSAITKISGWEKMSTSQISIAIGLSKNRLSQLFDEKSWGLPPKD